MATLTELNKQPADRPRDKWHCEQLLAVWRRVRERWPGTPEEAGRDSLLYAVALAFFYKGQTDYPDIGDVPRLLAALDQCLRLDLRNEQECEAALEQLDELPGVGLARASVILHSLHPGEFPIVDRNAAWVLCDWAKRGIGWPAEVTPPGHRHQDMTQKARAYLDYRRVLLGLVSASRGSLTLREVEFALYNAGRVRPRVEVTGL